MSDEQTAEERRQRQERRNLIDLTRAERGEPERRRLPGVERRDLTDEERAAEDAADRADDEKDDEEDDEKDGGVS